LDWLYVPVTVAGPEYGVSAEVGVVRPGFSGNIIALELEPTTEPELGELLVVALVDVDAAGVVLVVVGVVLAAVVVVRGVVVVVVACEVVVGVVVAVDGPTVVAVEPPVVEGSVVEKTMSA
jgi:hypothetical protein